jgi:hypothetical protein
VRAEKSKGASARMAESRRRKSPERTFILRNVVLSYPKIAEGEENDDGRLVYSASFITTPESNYQDIAKAELAAARDGFGEEAEKMLENGSLASTYRRGKADIQKCGSPHGYVNARAEERPGCVLRDKTRVTDLAEVKRLFYAGAIVNVSLHAFPYEWKGKKKGISFGLNNIQFVKDGPRLDGRKRAEDEFDALLDEPGSESELAF